MAEVYEVYKCEICTNIVEVVRGGKGTLVCCGKPMLKLEEKDADWKTEKHVPVVEKTNEGKYRVYVGSTLHPMTEEHYIMWIEAITERGISRKYLKPGNAPEAFFPGCCDILKAREFCNIHGLWGASALVGTP